MVTPSSASSTERLARVYRALETVLDPEIPVLNVLEMGIVADVHIDESGVTIDMTPTFAGCPALDVLRREMVEAVRAAGEPSVTVRVVYDPPWTTDRLSEEARRKLKAFGLAPPGPRCGAQSLPEIERVPCPYCDSTDTELETMFGPTLCRSIHYCHACRQSFEHFKAV
ncbi:MAG: phenylacetate-CoA oxygenase subunit PaaJ [Planctomycetota bacterium]|nr:MAG: phenylacetate-CoA oxygenase subunit PaaJ [Planctomycetota bacterium]